MNVLLIVASGKSSRFGGFPKAFCQLGTITNVENTIEKSKNLIDRVYIGVNDRIYEQFHDSTRDCEMFSIKTGQGDAHSLLKCIKHIKDKEINIDKFLVCWGDAVFASSKPFEEIMRTEGDAVVACSMDKQPYAWFDVNTHDEILKSHFAKEEGFIQAGMHDQSLFLFNIDFAYKYLDDYRISLDIPENNDEDKSDVNEMKLLYSFEYLLTQGCPAKICKITGDQVLSFNTQEELESIRLKLNL